MLPHPYCPGAVFTFGASGGAATCYGYAINDGTNLLWSEDFDLPVALAGPDDAVLVTPNLTVGVSDQDFGGGTVIQ